VTRDVLSAAVFFAVCLAVIAWVLFDIVTADRVFARVWGEHRDAWDRAGSPSGMSWTPLGTDLRPISRLLQGRAAGRWAMWKLRRDRSPDMTGDEELQRLIRRWWNSMLLLFTGVGLGLVTAAALLARAAVNR
jgi:hypothetical protein